MNAPNLPAYLQQYQVRDVGQSLAQNLGSAAPPYVSIAGGRFNLIDAAGNEMPVPTFDPQIGVYLDVCIIDSGDHLSRIYYVKDYDPSAQTFSPPDCWSDNGVGPSVSCSAPQAPSCTPDPNGVTGCRWAVWGSATSAQGKAVPACQQVQKIAVLTAHAPGTVFLLRVPPNSHKHLRAYNETCKGNGVMLANVITRIHFDPTTQGTLLFKGVSYIDEQTAQLRQAAYTEKKTDSLVGRTDVARTPMLAAPAQQQVAAPQQQGFQPAGTNLQDQQPATFGQHSQVQQPGPLQPQPGNQPSPVQNAVNNGQMNLNAPTAGTASPSDPAPTQRRRRRTAAEIAAQNEQAAGQSAPQVAQGAPQAPFPHAGQQTAQADPQAQFGIAQGQPAGANPELAGMLNSFFRGS